MHLVAVVDFEDEGFPFVWFELGCERYNTSYWPIRSDLALCQELIFIQTQPVTDNMIAIEQDTRSRLRSVCLRFVDFCETLIDIWSTEELKELSKFIRMCNDILEIQFE